jgi:hypothetical protein
MPIVLLTEAERQLLVEVIKIHLDGLELTKDLVIEDLTDERLLEATATVDEAVKGYQHLLKKVEHAV